MIVRTVGVRWASRVVAGIRSRVVAGQLGVCVIRADWVSLRNHFLAPHRLSCGLRVASRGKDFRAVASLFFCCFIKWWWMTLEPLPMGKSHGSCSWVFGHKLEAMRLQPTKIFRPRPQDEEVVVVHERGRPSAQHGLLDSTLQG